MAPPKKATAISHLRWLLLFPIPLAWCLLQQFGALSFFENKTIDWRFQVRGELNPPVKVVYVDVDSLSLSKIGGWPWNRAFFSRMASALVTEGGAKAVGFDFVFSDQGVAESVDVGKLVSGNAEFANFLRKDPPVILAAAYAGHTFLDVNGHEKHRVLPLVKEKGGALADIEFPEVPSFQRSLEERVFYNPPGIGLIDTIDNGTRWVPAWAPSGTPRPYFHISVELARLYWGLPPGSIKVQGDAIRFIHPDGTVQATVPLLDGQLLEINWFTHWASEKVKHFEFGTLFPVANALAEGDAEDRKIAKDFLAQGDFKDAVVLIGPVDSLFQDYAMTSLDEKSVPKVSVHGNLLNTIVSGKFLHRLPTWHGIPWLEYLILFALTIAVTTCGLTSTSHSLRGVGWKIAAVVALAAYAGMTVGVFSAHHLVLPFTAPLASAFTTSFAGLIWQVIEEQKAKSRIKGMFGTYLAPTVVEQMINSGKDPELGGHDSEITAYFSDIQKFSSFSEVLPSAKLGELLNEYLTACTDIVQAEMGTLDKYIGDAVVAMFGAPVEAPDHAYRACVASQLVQIRIAELREKWRSEGDKWPQLVHNLRTRIGLNTGICMIGNMGSRNRFNYTMMGDNVNLAARMESGAKSWGVYTMVTEATKLPCEKRSDRVVFRPLGRIVVQGRSQPVPVFEIVGLKEHVADRTHECLAVFGQGLAKYYAREWDAALALFEKSRVLEPNQPGESPGVSNNPSMVYLDIVEHCKVEPPPADWDGRYVMKEK